MARWTASAKWAAGPALDGQCATPLALSSTEGLGVVAPSVCATSGNGGTARLELARPRAATHDFRRLMADAKLHGSWITARRCIFAADWFLVANCQMCCSPPPCGGLPMLTSQSAHGRSAVLVASPPTCRRCAGAGVQLRIVLNWGWSSSAGRGRRATSLRRLTFEVSWRRRRGALDSKRKMGRRPCA